MSLEFVERTKLEPHVSRRRFLGLLGLTVVGASALQTHTGVRDSLISGSERDPKLAVATITHVESKQITVVRVDDGEPFRCHPKDFPVDWEFLLGDRVALEASAAAILPLTLAHVGPIAAEPAADHVSIGGLVGSVESSSLRVEVQAAIGVDRPRTGFFASNTDRSNMRLMAIW